MNYIIYENGKEINRIVASEEFCQDYCARSGCTYEKEPETEEPETPLEPEYTETQLLAQAITDQELALIEMGQQMTDLELRILGGGVSNV